MRPVGDSVSMLIIPLALSVRVRSSRLLGRLLGQALTIPVYPLWNNSYR